MSTKKLIRASRKYAAVNMIAACMMFAMLVGLLMLAHIQMADTWKDASRAQDKMNKFTPSTEAEDGLKKLLVHFSWWVQVQRAEFCCLVLIVFTFGFFGVYSFIVIRKVVAELAKYSDRTTHTNSTRDREKRDK